MDRRIFFSEGGSSFQKGFFSIEYTTLMQNNVTGKVKIIKGTPLSIVNINIKLTASTDVDGEDKSNVSLTGVGLSYSATSNAQGVITTSAKSKVTVNNEGYYEIDFQGEKLGESSNFNIQVSSPDLTGVVVINNK